MPSHSNQPKNKRPAISSLFQNIFFTETMTFLFSFTMFKTIQNFYQQQSLN